jgi:hypothetical protein
VIVRLMGSGQYRVDEGVVQSLNELDDDAQAALDASDEVKLDQTLDEMWQVVRRAGEPLPDEEIASSDIVIPPSDFTLEETRALLTDEGFIPDIV